MTGEKFKKRENGKWKIGGDFAVGVGGTGVRDEGNERREKTSTSRQGVYSKRQLAMKEDAHLPSLLSPSLFSLSFSLLSPFNLHSLLFSSLMDF